MPPSSRTHYQWVCSQPSDIGIMPNELDLPSNFYFLQFLLARGFTLFSPYSYSTIPVCFSFTMSVPSLQFRPLISLIISHSLRMTFLQNTIQLFRFFFKHVVANDNLPYILKQNWDLENLLLLLVCSVLSLFKSFSWELPRELYINNTSSQVS